MTSHGEVLRTLVKDDALVDAILEDPKTAALNDRRRAMVDYAWKLTRTPHDVTEGDIETLRGAGLTDVDISDVNGVCAYFNMLNRIASGLGVEGQPAMLAP